MVKRKMKTKGQTTI